MTIELSPDLYPEPIDAPLKMRLEPFFNRADVVQKMRDVAAHVLPVGTRHEVRKGYGMISWGLHDFIDGTKSADPHNLCAGIMHVLKASEDDKDMPNATRAGLKSVVNQMLAIVNTESTKVGTLKKNILDYAQREGITQEKGVG